MQRRMCGVICRVSPPLNNFSPNFLIWFGNLLHNGISKFTLLVFKIHILENETLRFNLLACVVVINYRALFNFLYVYLNVAN